MQIEQSKKKGSRNEIFFPKQSSPSHTSINKISEHRTPHFSDVTLFYVG